MKKFLLAFIAVIMVASVIAQNTVDLKINLEKNKVYRFKTVSDQNLSQTINGVQQTTATKSTSVFSIKMVDASADFIVAEVRFDTMITHTNAMGQEVIIHSAKQGDIKSSETGEVMSCIMNRLSKNPLFIKMNPSGKVIELINYKMLSGIILKDTGTITGPQASTIKMQIKGSINDKALVSMVEMFTYILPGKQVKEGEKWDMAVDFNSGGMSLNIFTHYDLVEIKDSKAGIHAESTIKASENAEPLNYSGAVITYNGISGGGKTIMQLDTKDGLVIENSSKTRITGNLDVSVQGMNMQIPVDIDSETSVNRIN